MRASTLGSPLRGKKAEGFTLLELLVVLSIIVILVGILYPSVNSAILSARASQVRNRVAELSDGCLFYRDENGYYPGQGLSNPAEFNHGTTGSQLLAEALFIDYSDKAWDGSTGKTNLTTANPAANRSRWHWRGVYAPLTFGTVANQATTIARSDLLTCSPSDPAVSAKPYCISDQFTNDCLPILYFPSHLTATDVSQFVEADNISYYNFVGSSVFALTTNVSPLPNYGWMSAGCAGSTDFLSFITDTEYNGTGAIGKPYRSGDFLLIAPGKDRIYGSRNTIKNWTD
jgi:prepilin-type N-terminal cleavage/methylation domain-containing protein